MVFVQEIRYTIGAVAARTGLSPHTIRAWERRYGALSPDRTDTNRRLYNDEDVVRLELLHQVTLKGHSIGHVAQLSIEELNRLVRLGGGPSERPMREVRSDSDGHLLAQCVAAIEALDPDQLETILVRGTIQLGINGLLDSVVVPLLEVIGQRWELRTLGIAQEHLATAVLRTYLDRVRLTMTPNPSAPKLLVATPRHQNHELGALLVAISAATAGWRVTYVGPNLPAQEIVMAANRAGCDAVALSVVYPEDDLSLAEEFRMLKNGLDPRVVLYVGGRAAPCYEATLGEVKAQVIESLPAFRARLQM